MRSSIPPRLLPLLAPYLVGALLLVGLPALLTFGVSLFGYDGMSPPFYRGLANFREIANEPLLRVALGNSLFFIALAVPLRLLGALGLALLYRRPRRGARLYRAAACAPSVIPDVAYALAWLWMLNPLYGPVNGLLAALGLPTPAWLVEMSTAKPALALMALFQVGEGFVILLAGLKQISPELYDAARVDGAGRWQALRYITLPRLAPWLLLLSVRDVALSFQSTFTPAYIMTGGDPYYATLFLPLLIYEEAFDGLRFGPAAAMMLLMFLIVLGLILLVLGLFPQGWDDES